MKKILAMLLAVLTLSSVSISALAADTDSTDSSLVTVTDSNTSDPAYATVKQDYAAVVSLREQDKTLRDNIGTLTQSNKSAEGSIRTELKNALTAAKAVATQTLQPIKDEITQLRQQRQSIASEIATAKVNKDTATLTSLKTQLAAITRQIKDDQTKLKASAPDLTAYKNLVTQFNTTKSQLETLKTQMVTAVADIRTAQSKIDTDWNSFKTAMSSKDYATADSVLKDIISGKQQINTDLDNVASLKQQVSTLLSGFASTIGTGSTDSSNA